MKIKQKTQKVTFRMTVPKEFSEKIRSLSEYGGMERSPQAVIHNVMHWWTEGNIERLDSLYRAATHDASRFKGAPCKINPIESVRTNDGRWAKALPSWRLFKVSQKTKEFGVGDVVLVAEYAPSAKQTPYGYWWGLGKKVESRHGHLCAYRNGKQHFLGAWDGQEGMTVIGLALRRFSGADFSKPQNLGEANAADTILITDRRIDQVKKMRFV